MEDEPALGFYKMGAWQSREYTAQEEDEHAPLQRDLVLEFRPDDFGEVRAKLPLAFINSEARAVALSRASQHGIETRFCQDTQSHVFMRAFRPTIDTVYVPFHRWEDFFTEPQQVESEIHSLNRAPVIYEGWMTRLDDSAG